MDNPSPNPPPNPVSPPSFIPTVEETPSMPQSPLPDTGGAPILTNPTAFISSPPSKGTGWPRKNIIATVLGLVLLVGGIGAGVILVGQRQIFKPKADVCTVGDTSCSDWTHVVTCEEDTYGYPAWGAPELCDDHCSGGRCVGGGGSGTPTPSDKCDNSSDTASVCRGKTVGDIGSCQINPATCTGATDNALICKRTTGTKCSADCGYSSGCSATSIPPVSPSPGQCGVNCIVYYCPSGCSGGCGENTPGVTIERNVPCGEAWGKIGGNTCGQVDTVDSNGAYCIPTSGDGSKFNCVEQTAVCAPAATPSDNPDITPTPAPNTPPQCINIKVYDTSWKQLATSDLTNLKAGDKINLAVAGSKGSSGTIDKAKFKVNGTDLTETTQKHNSEFYSEYTVPASVTSFSVNVQLHHTVNGWF